MKKSFAMSLSNLLIPLFLMVFIYSLIFSNMAEAEDDPIHNCIRDIQTKVDIVSDADLNLNNRSILTIREINQSNSWEELLYKFQNITFGEDKYVKYLIDGINKRQMIPAYHDLGYVSYRLGGIPLNYIDSKTLKEKFQSVIEMYNRYHDLQLKIMIKTLNEHYMQLEVESTNVEYIQKPVEEIGQLAHIRLGTVYWKSSEKFGSGEANVVSTINPYIPKDNVVIVDEVAYLDDNGNVLNIYSSGKIETWEKRMLHIRANGIDLGWVYPTHLTNIQ